MQKLKKWRVSTKRPEDSSNSTGFYSTTQAAIYSSSRAIKRIQERLTMHALSLCLFPESSRVLDAGCGNGFSTRVLLDLGYDAIGVDSSPEMIALAKKNGINALLGDLRKLPFPANEFDGLISISVLEWVASEASKVAREFRRVLKQGGKGVLQFYPSSSRELEGVGKAFRDAGFKTTIHVENEGNARKRKVFVVVEKR